MAQEEKRIIPPFSLERAIVDLKRQVDEIEKQLQRGEKPDTKEPGALVDLFG